MKNLFYPLSLLIGVLLVLFLQYSFQPYFFYIEQSQLFLWDSAYFLGHLSLPGGFSGWLSESVIQYYSYPFVGALCTGLWVTATALLAGSLLKRISGTSLMAMMGWIPALSLLLVAIDFNYLQAGNVAFLLCLLAASLYVRIPTFSYRLLAGILLLPLLAWWGSSVYMLFAVMAFLYEILLPQSSKQRLSSVSLLVVAALLATYFYQSCMVDTWGKAISPSSYYISKLIPGKIIYASWVSLLLLVGLAGLVSRKEGMMTGKRRTIAWVVELAFVLAFAYMGLMKFADKKSMRFMELDYYSRTGQWEKIEQACQGKLTNYLYMSILSRALAEEGKLIDELFQYDIRSERALAISWNSTENVSVLLSDLYFTCGNTALAQRMAFEGDVSAHGAHNVRMIQRLVQTNLVFGAYPIAEKYIALLEKSPIYKKWATPYRRFLNNDKLVEEDPLLGEKRALLFTPGDSNEVFISGGDFVQAVAEPLLANPDKARTAFEYLAGFYLLSRDMSSFISFVNQFKETSLLSPMPRAVQEGILIAYEGNPEKWKDYQLDDNIKSQFEEFRKQVLSNRNNQGLPGLLHRSFGNTYWYYLMFK